jgi:hypothetical protein
LVNTGENRDWDPLQKGLTDLLISDLGKIKTRTVVERGHVQKMMDETKITVSGMRDETRCKRLARLLGASGYVTGTFNKLPDGRIHLQVAAADLATGQTKVVESLNGYFQSLFYLEKQAVFSLARHLGLTPRPEEEQAVQAYSTESMPAFLAYAKGLDNLDQGLFPAARQAFEQARQLDRRFTAAQAHLEEAIVLSQPFRTPEEMEKFCTPSGAGITPNR